MKNSKLFLCRPPRFTCLLLICLCSAAWSAAVFANGDGDGAPVRPVARLITSIRPATTTTSRAPSAPVSSRSRTALIAANSKPAARGVVSPAVTTAMAAATSVERRAFDMVNQQRIAKGEQPFIWDAQLTSMARIHSQNMATQNFFNHVGPDGQDMVARAHACEIYGWRTLGENIAYNQGLQDPAAFAVERWMHSTKHRTNILNTQFSRSGIGTARAADGRIFFTQVFAAR